MNHKHIEYPAEVAVCGQFFVVPHGVTTYCFNQVLVPCRSVSSACFLVIRQMESAGDVVVPDPTVAEISAQFPFRRGVTVFYTGEILSKLQWVAAHPLVAKCVQAIKGATRAALVLRDYEGAGPFPLMFNSVSDFAGATVPNPLFTVYNELKMSSDRKSELRGAQGLLILRSSCEADSYANAELLTQFAPEVVICNGDCGYKGAQVMGYETAAEEAHTTSTYLQIDMTVKPLVYSLDEAVSTISSICVGKSIADLVAADPELLESALLSFVGQNVAFWRESQVAGFGRIVKLEGGREIVVDTAYDGDFEKAVLLGGASLPVWPGVLGGM